MAFWDLLLLAVGLAMDAFAVSLCKGLEMEKLRLRDAGVVALFFGGFQAGMPLLGWLLGRQFAGAIDRVDHWIAFGLLAAIGAQMLREAFKKDPKEVRKRQRLQIRELLVLAVATSIDALTVGLTLAFLQVPLGLAVALIGVVTFLLSFVGVILGFQFGVRWKSKAEIVGGCILILIGLKILLQHLGVV